MRPPTRDSAPAQRVKASVLQAEGRRNSRDSSANYNYVRICALSAHEDSPSGASHEEIDGLRAARVFHVVKTIAQEFVQSWRLVSDESRSEDCVVVCVPTVLEEKHLSSGFQDAFCFAEQFFSGTARGNLVRPEPKTNRIAEASAAAR